MEEKNKLLVLIDPQVGFVTGNLKVGGGKAAMDRLANWLKKTDIKFSAIMYTQDWHPENHCSFVEQGGPFPKHCVQYTEDAEIYPSVERAVLDYCRKNSCVHYVDYFYKGRDKDTEEFSGLSSIENKERFVKLLEDAQIGEIWIAGLATDYCVLETLKDIASATNGKQDIVVMYDCMAAVDPDGDRMKEFNDFVNSTAVVRICEVQKH
jgi:nicotinamidase/pyrazinamidase